MKKILLTKGKICIIDDNLFDYLSRWRWHFNSGYAMRGSRKSDGLPKRKILMHRVINNTKSGYETDHINGNSLDNRRENLRTVNHLNNGWNQKKSINNSSGHKGVYWNKRDKAWYSYIGYRGKVIFLGYFKSYNDACSKYEIMSNTLFGQFNRKENNGN